MDDKDLVPKGIEPICGWAWVYEHLHDLDGWTPTFEIIREGVKHSIVIKDIKVMAEVSKLINKKE